MGPRGQLCRAALYALPVGLLLYVFWPLLNGKPLDEPPRKLVVLSAWKFTNCGRSSDPLQISVTHLEVGSDETLAVSVEIHTDTLLGPTLQLNISQWTQKAGGVWEPRPCTETSGSCYYEDICTSLARTNCPSLRGELEPSMACPLAPGSFSMPTHHFPVEPELLLKSVATRYHFLHHGAHLACYDLLTMGEAV